MDGEMKVHEFHFCSMLLELYPLILPVNFPPQNNHDHCTVQMGLIKYVYVHVSV